MPKMIEMVKIDIISFSLYIWMTKIAVNFLYKETAVFSRNGSCI